MHSVDDSVGFDPAARSRPETSYPCPERSAQLGKLLVPFCQLTRAARGAVLWVDPARQRAVVVQTSGSRLDAPGSGTALARVGPLVENSLAHGSPLVAHGGHELGADYPLHSAARSAAIVPIAMRDEGAWVVCFDDDRPETFGDEMRPLLDAMAQLGLEAVSAIDHREERLVFQQRFEERQRLAALGETVAGIAHEINNPLTAIIGLASLVQKRLAKVEPPLKEAVDAIANESLRLADIARMVTEASRKSGAMQRFDLNDVARQAVFLRRFPCRKARVALDLRLCGREAGVDGSPQKILQVLLNLLINAEQAVQERGGAGRVELEIRDDRQSHIVATVRDNGPGVSDEVLAQLFEPFFTTKPAGTGLGLSIARSIAREHGGDLRLVETSEDGTAFALSLPRGGAADRSGALELRQSGGATKRPSGAGARRVRALIVDDEPSIVQAIAGCLRLRGVECDSATTGSAALGLLRSKEFDLVLLDFHLRDMTASEILERVRGESGRAIEFIIMTGMVDNPTISDFINTAGLRSLGKPFSCREIESHLQRAVERVRSAGADAGGMTMEGMGTS